MTFISRSLIGVGLAGASVTTVALTWPKSESQGEEYKATEEEKKIAKKGEEQCGKMDFPSSRSISASEKKNSKGILWEDYLKCILRVQKEFSSSKKNK